MTISKPKTGERVQRENQLTPETTDLDLRHEGLGTYCRYQPGVNGPSVISTPHMCV